MEGGIRSGKSRGVERFGGGRPRNICRSSHNHTGPFRRHSDRNEKKRGMRREPIIRPVSSAIFVRKNREIIHKKTSRELLFRFGSLLVI